MHTAVADTSIRAYRNIKKDGTLSKRQKEILAKMAPYPADYSLQELVKLTGLPVNIVSGRVNELREDLCVVERGPARACKVTGKTIRPHRRPHPQKALF
jgi:hypothetical protein